MKRLDGRRGFKAESAEDAISSRGTLVGSERFSSRQNGLPEVVHVSKLSPSL
jgi:hypothetical protein